MKLQLPLLMAGATVSISDLLCIVSVTYLNSLVNLDLNQVAGYRRFCTSILKLIPYLDGGSRSRG